MVKIRAARLGVVKRCMLVWTQNAKTVAKTTVIPRATTQAPLQSGGRSFSVRTEANSAEPIVIVTN